MGMVQAIVREWRDDQGWGVLDSPETPGGCWTHYSAIDARMIGRSPGVETSKFKSLTAGELVELQWETPGQDGFDYRACEVRRRG